MFEDTILLTVNSEVILVVREACHIIYLFIKALQHKC